MNRKYDSKQVILTSVLAGIAVFIANYIVPESNFRVYIIALTAVAAILITNTLYSKFSIKKEN